MDWYPDGSLDLSMDGSMDDAATDTNFPSEFEDFDGKDLREVIADGNHQRPSTWPAEDRVPDVHKRDPVVVSSYREITVEDWSLHEKFQEIRLVGIKKRTQQTFLASYLHFRDCNEFNYFVDTHVSARLQSYFMARRQQGHNIWYTSILEIITELESTRVEGQQTAEQYGQVYTEPDYLQKIFAGSMDFQSQDEYGNQELDDKALKGLTTISAAYTALRHFPEHLCIEDSKTCRLYLNYGLEAWLRAVLLVLYYYTRRIGVGGKKRYNFYQLRSPPFVRAPKVIGDDHISQYKEAKRRVQFTQSESATPETPSNNNTPKRRRQGLTMKEVEESIRYSRDQQFVEKAEKLMKSMLEEKDDGAQLNFAFQLGQLESEAHNDAIRRSMGGVPVIDDEEREYLRSWLKTKVGEVEKMECPSFTEGGSVSLDNELKGAKIYTVHVKLQGLGRVIYDRWQEQLGDSLYVAGPEDADNEDDENTVRINPGVWQALSLLAINPNNERLLRLEELNHKLKHENNDHPSPPPDYMVDKNRPGVEEDDKDAEIDIDDDIDFDDFEYESDAWKKKHNRDQSDDEDEDDDDDADDADEGYKGYIDPHDKSPGRAYRGKDDEDEDEDDFEKVAKGIQNRADARDEQAAMGVEEVETLIKLDKNGGADWVHMRTKDDEMMAVPEDPIRYFQYLISRSPLLCAQVLQILEWIEAPIGPEGLPNRVLVVVNTPWNQQEMLILLQMIGVKAKSIRAALVAQARANIIQEFNDAESDLQVLIITPILGALGSDMQTCCNKGMLQLWCWNANMVDQVLGRLIRIGQKRFVEWHLYTVNGTIYEKYERIIWRKHARQMAAESDIPAGIKGELGIVLMYEFIRVMYNQPFNRYLWEVLNPAIPSYDNPHLRKAADMISRIARWAYYNHHDCDILAGKHPLDLYAGAVRHMRLKQESGHEIDISAAWLDEHASSIDWDARNDDLVPKSEVKKIMEGINSQKRTILKITKAKVQQKEEIDRVSLENKAAKAANAKKERQERSKLKEQAQTGERRSRTTRPETSGTKHPASSAPSSSPAAKKSKLGGDGDA